MSEFKDALDNVLNHAAVYGISKDDEIIVLALKIADKIMNPASENMKHAGYSASVSYSGETYAASHHECDDIFLAMIREMLKEIDNELQPKNT